MNNEEKVSVEFTVTEMNVLNQLLDVALKAGGRNVVNGFMLIDGKLKRSVEATLAEEQDVSAS